MCISRKKMEGKHRKIPVLCYSSSLSPWGDWKVFSQQVEQGTGGDQMSVVNVSQKASHARWVMWSRDKKWFSSRLLSLSRRSFFTILRVSNHSFSLTDLCPTTNGTTTTSHSRSFTKSLSPLMWECVLCVNVCRTVEDEWEKGRHLVEERGLVFEFNSVRFTCRL